MTAHPTPTPAEPHHDVHSRRFELHRDTAPAAPDSTDVRREVARLRRALSRLWEATNAHTRDDRTYDRLRADRDTLDEALLAVADEVRCGWCGAKPTHAPEDCPRARDCQSQQIADAQTAADDEGGQA